LNQKIIFIDRQHLPRKTTLIFFKTTSTLVYIPPWKVV